MAALLLISPIRSLFKNIIEIYSRLHCESFEVSSKNLHLTCAPTRIAFEMRTQEPLALKSY